MNHPPSTSDSDEVAPPPMRDRRRTARLEREKALQEAARQAKRPRWHSPGVVAWLCFTVAVVVLLSLSLWQFRRLEWKEGLLSSIALHQLSRAYGGLPDDPELVRNQLAFARVYLSGEYLHDEEVHLAARYHLGKLGYHVLTPFRLEDGRIVLLNRGWVPSEQKEPSSRPLSQPEGIQRIVAMVRADPDRTAFTPEHDKQDNIWFWKDIEGISAMTGYDLFPVNLDALYDAPPGGLPVPSNGLLELRNDHFGYAITWLLLCVGAVVVFVAYHYRVPAPPEHEEAGH